MKKIFLSISILFLMSVVVYSASLNFGIDKDGVYVGDGIVVGSATAVVLISSSTNATNSMDCQDWGLYNYGPFNVFIGSSSAITTSTSTATVGSTLNSRCLLVGDYISIGGINQGPVYGKQASGNLNSIIYRDRIDLKKRR